MMHVLPFDLVELVPCPAMSPMAPSAALREIAYREDAWLPGEIDALRTAFDADEDLQAIANNLDRTLAAIKTKVGELGLRRHSTRLWSELEDDTLIRDYGKVATSDIAAAFGRTPAAVYARAGLLRLTEENPPSYTAWEIAQIRAAYAQGVPVSQLAVLIMRPVSGIASLASKLHIAHANGLPDWSAEEQQRALALAEDEHPYRRIAASLAAEGFPVRRHNAVGQALRKLGYGRGWGRAWLVEEDDLLRQAYANSDSLTPLRQRLGRTPGSIHHRAGELGLRGSHARPNGWRTEPSWSDEDVAILRRDYGKVPTPALAAALRRKKGGVFNKAFSLGLVHGWMRAFSEEEDQAIRIARAGTISLPDLSLALNRDPAVVSKHAIKMGIPFATRPHPVPRGPRRNRPRLSLASILAQEIRGDTPASRELEGTAAPPHPAALPPVALPMPGVPALPQTILVAMQKAGLLTAVATTAGFVLLASQPQR